MAQEGGPHADGKVFHHGDSFANYMAIKNQKLQEQFREQAQTTASTTGADSLFAGVSIHVNGLTQPSHAELKILMAQHGGVFENYYSRASVTHIICAHLTDQKVKLNGKERCASYLSPLRAHQLLLRRLRRAPVPIVRPEWIVDSIAAGQRLPVSAVRSCQLQVAGMQAADMQRLTDRRLCAVAPARQARPADAEALHCPAACAF